MNLFASSKTFLLGEYGVLKTSPSLILCTDPQFCLDCDGPLNVNEPILSYLKEHSSDMLGNFYDPWNGTGGFGASSAQFALFYKKINPNFEIQKESISTLLNTYRKYFWNCEGLAPSGHDVIAQMMGSGIHFIDPEKGNFQTLDVSLEGYDFIVTKTSHKIATHRHLTELQVMDLDLRDIVIQAKEGIENNNLLQVVSAIEEQNRILIQNELVCKSTLELRESFEELDGVIITKGCGAMGADTILIVCEREQTRRILKKINSAVIWKG